MLGVEINLVVPNVHAAYAFYQKVFATELVESTDLETGLNELVFTLYGTRFHLLDENPEYQLLAPQPGQSQAMWCNVLVEDIKRSLETALELGATEIQPLMEIEAMGVSLASFQDPFGQVWLLHQMHRELSFEDRMQHLVSALE